MKVIDWENRLFWKAAIIAPIATPMMKLMIRTPRRP